MHSFPLLQVLILSLISRSRQSLKTLELPTVSSREANILVLSQELTVSVSSRFSASTSRTNPSYVRIKQYTYLCRVRRCKPIVNNHINTSRGMNVKNNCTTATTCILTSWPLLEKQKRLGHVSRSNNVLSRSHLGW